LLETHILNFSGSLYRKKIKILFLKFLRKNENFQNFEQLKARLVRDKTKAISLLTK